MDDPAPSGTRWGLLVAALLVGVCAGLLFILGVMALMFGFPLMDGKASGEQTVIGLALLATPVVSLLAIGIAIRAIVIAIRGRSTRAGSSLLVALFAMVIACVCQAAILGVV